MEVKDKVVTVEGLKGAYDDLNGKISSNDADITALQESVTQLNSDLLEKVYPIGSIYMSVNSTNPSTYFGGTWVAWGSGRVPVGVNTSDTNFSTVEKTGGASSVTLTAAQSGVPAHAHGLNSHTHSLGSHTHTVTNGLAYKVGTTTIGRKNVGSGSSLVTFASTTANDLIYGATADAASGKTGAASGNTANSTAKNATSAHTNLQPYITCYMFKRTA